MSLWDSAGRSSEYELDDFDWLHGRDAAGDVPESLRSRNTLYALGLISLTPIALGLVWLVRWLLS